MPEIETEDGDAISDEMAEIPAPAPIQEEAKVVPVQVEPKPAPEPVIAPVVAPVEEVVEETAEPEVVSEPEPVVEEPVIEEPIAEEPVIEEPVAEQPQPEEPEEPVVPEIPETQAIPEIPDAPESPSSEEEQPEEEAQEEQEDSISEFYDDENNECKKVFLMYAIIVNVIVAALFFVFGYYARSTNMLGIEKDTAVETAAPVVEQPETTTPKATETATPAKAEETTTAVEKKEEKKPVAEPKREEKTEAKAEATSKYDSDPRVRTGAYRIVGVANTVTVKSGQTIKSISKTYLGAGMECYVEAFNGGITELREGQTIKIPKLELKKKAKKANK
jgi:hypothetical protein